MFSDTHFHFKMMVTERNIDGTFVLSQMAKNDCFFGLDIGTRCDDIFLRYESVNKALLSIQDKKLLQKAKKLIKFSAGIWPDIEEIKNRNLAIKTLENSIEQVQKEGCEICAIGEGGLDHHWNPYGADGRKQEDFNLEIYLGEKELFMMQLELAQKIKVPMIVHSRDAFEDSLDCIKNVGYHNGIIHCFSYGIKEARTFLDLGWYIALGGGITYTKKSKMDEMIELIKFIPDDRLLCETDSPYLAPVPHRGESNSPLFINFVYDFISKARQTSVNDLSEIVDQNIRNLFCIQ